MVVADIKIITFIQGKYSVIGKRITKEKGRRRKADGGVVLMWILKFAFLKLKGIWDSFAI